MKSLTVRRCPGSVGKLIRLKSTLSSDQSLDGTRPFPFLLLDGFIADLRAWKDGDGTVSGISNFAPKTTMRFWQLLNKSNLEPKEAEELSQLESALSRADVHAVPAGVRGMSTYNISCTRLSTANRNVEYALHKMHGYSITPRRPLLPLGKAEGDRFMAVLEEVLRIESTLA
jgi:4-hydroxy-2-oxoglutarate aldolase